MQCDNEEMLLFLTIPLLLLADHRSLWLIEWQLPRVVKGLLIYVEENKFNLPYFSFLRTIVKML